MSATNDLDRALAAWLAEGPAHAPESPMTAATEHARSNPRRRDPFAGLRRDPMASRGRSNLGLRPALVLAVVVLATAAVAIGVVGSRPAVTPSIESPSPVVSMSPMPSPSPTPAPTPITASVLDVGGGEVTTMIEDASGRLVSATSEAPSEGAFVDGGLAVTNDGPNRLRLRWTDLPCSRQTGYLVLVDAGVTAVAVTREACGGDTLPFDRILVLEFDGPIDAADVTGTLDLPVQGEG